MIWQLFSCLFVCFGVVLYFFNWSIVTLQCCVSFCCIMKWISYMYTYIPSFLDLPPPPSPPSWSPQGPELSLLCYAQVPASCLFYTQQCIYANLPIHLTPLPHPRCIRMSILWICITIPTFSACTRVYPFTSSATFWLLSSLGSYAKSRFSQTIFWSHCSIFAFPPMIYESSCCSASLPAFSVVTVSDLAIEIGTQRCIIVLIWISLRTYDMENLIIC